MHPEELAFLDRADKPKLKMSYIETETRGHVTRRLYRAIDEKDAKGFASIWNGYAYETMPDYWVVII